MKTIIIYASKYGCTRKAAYILASKFYGDTQVTDIQESAEIDLSGFDTVIIGGSAYRGRIQKELTRFMRKNTDLLKQRRLGLFMCAGEQDPAEVEKQMANSFPQKLRDKAIISDCFGGALHLEKISGTERRLIYMVKKIDQNYERLSEEKITAFAKAMA